MSGGEPARRAERGTDMERKKKPICGIRIALFAILAAVYMTGCTSREDVFLEEIAGDTDRTEGTENAEATGSAGEKQTETEAGKENGTVTESGEIDDLASGDIVSLVTQIPQTIFVDVCGAVANPGVYELDAGSRIFQAVDAAGGYLPEAAQNYLNRARSLTDGQQIYVPTEEEIAENLEALAAKVPEALQSSASEDTGREGNSEDSLAEGTGSDSVINLNTADAAQLCTLSGIGQSKAEAIIAYREEHGEFASIEGIMNVEGIKEGTFSKIKDKISVG